jgi:hypothetical protein
MKKRKNSNGCLVFMCLPLLAFAFVVLVYWLATVIGITPMKYIDFAVVIISLLLVIANKDASPEEGWRFVWFITGVTLLAGSITAGTVLGDMPN